MNSERSRARPHLPRSLIIAAALAVLPAMARVSAADDAAYVVASFRLPDIALSTLQNEVLPEHPIATDHGLLLGGVGSDLWHDPNDPADEFWMVTDRGPNAEVEVDDDDRRTFPVPDFTPLILHVRAGVHGITILEAIPIVDQAGDPVTGLPNLPGVDEKPFDFSGEELLALDQDGLDVEGFVRTADGGYWLAEEYRPSLVQVDPTGQVIARFVPAGIELPAAGYPVADTLPAIYAMRKENRGFEGLALSGDGQTLYAVVQSPLSNPNEDAGEASRNARILAVDAATGEPTAEYVYRFDDSSEFGEDDQDEMKLSALVWLDESTLLALERTDDVARLYLVDLATATDILGTVWDDPDKPGRSLEELSDPDTEQITPLPKTLLVDLAPLDLPEKIEGVAVIDGETVAVVNDNDFAVGEFQDGQHIGTGVTSQLIVLRTPPFM